MSRTASSPAAYGSFRSARDGSIYCELMISPDHATDVGMSYEALVDGVTEGVNLARTSTGIEARLIITAVRHRGPEAAVKIARRAEAYPHPLVTGFGMAGNERCYRPREFARAFKIAQDAGLLTTCHTGEFCGPDSIWETVSELGVKRIGHGVRCVEDERLLNHLAEKGIVLEVCPTSNLKLGLYRSPREHPLLKLIRAGCRVTLNTDDPAHFDGSLMQEYQDAQINFNLSDHDLANFTKTAIEAGFCDEKTRRSLIALVAESTSRVSEEPPTGVIEGAIDKYFPFKGDL